MNTDVNPRVKICGLMRPQDVEAAIRHGAAYLGFIVEAKSKRRLSVAEAARLSLPAKSIIPRIAVTVNADRSMIAEIIEHMQPDYIQFHGDEAADHIAAINRDFGVGTIKALPVSNTAHITAAMEYAGCVDYLLFDARPPKGTDVRGGHGLAFDWNILRGAALPKTWFLAGGLNPDNVGNALKTGAPILDVSSGVESAAGVKDHEKMKMLLALTLGHR